MKKPLIIVVVIILVLVAAGLFIKGLLKEKPGAGGIEEITPSEGGRTEAIEEPVTSVGPELKPGLSEKEREEMCVELSAYTYWWSYLAVAKHDYSRAEMIANKIEALEKKYKISDEYYDEVCILKIGDPEFMDKVAKRMQELGFVVK